MVQEMQLQWKTNRKSCMAYRLPMTFSEAEGHFCCFKLL